MATTIKEADAESGNGTYDHGDFTQFLNDGSETVLSDDGPIGEWKTGTNHWTGSKWDLLANGGAAPNHGPWTELSAGWWSSGCKWRQDDPEVQWVIRRWESDVDSPIKIVGGISKNANGDGTIGRIFVDGVEVWSQKTLGDSHEFEVMANVSVGSIVDVAIDPDGAGAYDPGDPMTVDNVNDGSDSTNLSFQIIQVPEPSSLVLCVFGILGLLRLRR